MSKLNLTVQIHSIGIHKEFDAADRDVRVEKRACQILKGCYAESDVKAAPA